MRVKELVSDELWAMVEPELPQPKRRARWKGGRPRVPDRACLTGIIFVLKTGIPWEYLPQEMGCGSGMTCWRRLRDWEKAGVWERVWCGSASGVRCWTSWPKQMQSIGAGLRWIRVAFRRKKGS